ncbi:MAG TPA: Gfo/Idh/MocA family oxidoreductase [Blastocatellia bacterium]|nr:Gfo/Idh/MocA family oxidoreductase [Blastocatellia bacterium]
MSSRIGDPSNRVAVIGSGYWGINHVRNFYQLGALEMVCDTSPQSLQRVSSLFPGIRTTTDLGAVFLDSSIHAVVIATPAETHYRLARQAVDAGKHVLVEKPLTLDVGDGLQLVEEARRRGAVLMVGHLLEYHPAVLRLRELIDRGHLGELRYVYSNRLNLGKVRREENILWSFAPHDIAIILRLVGAMPSVVAATGGAYLQEKIADVTVTNLEFASGVRGHVFVSWLHPYKEQRLVVVGSKRMAVFDDVRSEDKLVVYDQRVDIVNGEAVIRKNKGAAEMLEPFEPLRRQSEEFLRCIASRSTPITDGESGLRVLRVLDAAERSLSSGGLPVRLSEP